MDRTCRFSFSVIISMVLVVLCCCVGRDGLTHNMLNDIHNHWKHAEAVRIKCLGVPTVDMKNVCFQLEVPGFFLMLKHPFFSSRHFKWKENARVCVCVLHHVLLYPCQYICSICYFDWKNVSYNFYIVAG